MSSEKQATITVCINMDCRYYGESQYGNAINCINCHKRLKIRNGIDEPVNIVDGEVKSYDYRKKGVDL